MDMLDSRFWQGKKCLNLNKWDVFVSRICVNCLDLALKFELDWGK